MKRGIFFNWRMLLSVSTVWSTEWLLRMSTIPFSLCIEFPPDPGQRRRPRWKSLLPHLSPAFPCRPPLPHELRGPDPVASTQQQFVHGERESLTICEKERSSRPREDGVVEGRLDS